MANTQQIEARAAITKAQQDRENQTSISASDMQKKRRQEEKTARIGAVRKEDLQRQMEGNAAISKAQADYDARYGTQAQRAKTTGGVYQQGGNIVTATPAQPITVETNQMGGKHYGIGFEETLSFDEGINVQQYELASKPIESKNRFQKVGNDPIMSEFDEYFQSGTEESKAVANYLGQYKSTERPSRTVIEGVLAEKGINPEEISPKGRRVIELLTGNFGGTTIDFGSSTYFDPRTGKKFSAKTGEGDIEFGRQLAKASYTEGIPSSPAQKAQSSAIIQGVERGTTLQQRQQEGADVQAIDKFLSGYKSTTPPPRTVVEGYLEEQNIPLSDAGRTYLETGVKKNIDTGQMEKYFSGVENIGTSYDRSNYQNLGATYTNPKTGETYNTATGEGSKKLARELGYETAADIKPEPLRALGENIDIASQSLEQKSLKSKQILDSDASFGTKAKAFIEGGEAEIGKAGLSLAGGVLNLFGMAQSYKYGQKYVPYTTPAASLEDTIIERNIQMKGKDILGTSMFAVQDYGRKYGVSGIIGSGVFSLATTVVPTALAVKAVQPIKYTKYFITTAKEGDIIASRQLSLVAGQKSKTFVGKYAGGSIFGGKPKPEKLPYEKFDIPESRGLEQRGFSATQSEIFKSHVPYLIEKKIVNPNVQQTQNLVSALKESKKLPYEYRNELPKDIFGEDISPQDTTKIMQAVAKQQGKNIAAAKGGLTESMVQPKGNIFSSGDIRGIIEQEYGAKYAADVGTFPIKNFPVKDIDLDELKEGSGILAASEIEKTALSKGALQRVGSGSNVMYGQKGQPVFEDLAAGEAYHGSSPKNLKGIMQEGINPELDVKGRGTFATPSGEIAGRYSSSQLLKLGYKKSDVLFFNKLPKKTRQELYSPDYLQFQRNVKDYALARGYKGVTKPYQTRNPFSSRYEIIFFDKDVVKDIGMATPLRYDVKEGTGREIINIVQQREEPLQQAAGSKYATKSVFGMQYPKETFGAKIAGSSKTFDIFKRPYQNFGITSSTTALQSTASLKGMGMAEGDIAKVLGGYRVSMFASGNRPKDVVSQYMGLLQQGRLQLEAGQTQKALKTYRTAATYRKTYEPTFNWEETAAKYSQEGAGDFSKYVPTGAQGSYYGIGKQQVSVGKYAGYAGTPKQQKRESSYSISPKKSQSIKSLLSMKSQKSIAGSSMMAGSIGSAKSATSYKAGSKGALSYASPKSQKSMKSILSWKSMGSIGSLKSIASVGSFGSFGSFVSYGGSRSGKSYGSGRSYGGSSPSGSAFSPKSIPSTMLPKSLQIIVTEPPLPPILKGNVPNKRQYPRKEKPTKTFRWTVRNPFSEAFTIREGKKGRKIEEF